jgi:hypothetical protein
MVAAKLRGGLPKMAWYGFSPAAPFTPPLLKLMLHYL